MADAGARRHDAEIIERALAPAQEGVALLIALELDLHILAEGLRIAEIVDHHRVIDDEIDRRERIDLLRIAAELHHRFAHRGEIDHRRHAGQILHQHARRQEGDLALRGLVLQPLREGLDVVDRDRAAVLEPHQILQQHLHREGQARDIAEPGRLCRRFEAEIIVILAADGEGTTGFQQIMTGDGQFFLLGTRDGGEFPAATAFIAPDQAVEALPSPIMASAARPAGP